MKIRKAPYPIDFLGNSPEYILRATPWSTEGRMWSGVFAVHGLPEGKLTVSIDGENLTWTLSAYPGDGLFEMMAETTDVGMLDTLEAKLVYNPQLNRDFTASAEIVTDTNITGGLPTVRLTLTAREPGPHTVNVYHTNANETTANNNIMVTAGGKTGLTRTPRKDWRAMAFFRIATSENVYKTPEMLFEESGGDVHVSTEIIRAYMPKPDIPGWGEFFTAKPCSNATAKVRLYYGEMYAGRTLTAGTGVPALLSAANRQKADGGIVLHSLMRSDEVTLVNGELQEHAFLNNIPDWETADKIHFYLRSDIHSVIGIFGQDDNDTILTPHGTEQYIYVYNFGSSNVTARVQASATLANGNTDDNWQDENVTLRPGVNRITVREDDSDVVALRVEVGVNHIVKAVRNYILKAFDHGFHTFLMLNALNLYETFIVEEIAREESTEGERRVIAGRDSYDTSDRQTVYTAKCHPRNAKGLKLLRTAFGKQDNLLLEGRYAWYVDMLPGSLTTSDEGSDLTECEFKFRLREKVNRAPQVIEVGGEINMSEQIVATDTVFK